MTQSHRYLAHINIWLLALVSWLVLWPACDLFAQEGTRGAEPSATEFSKQFVEHIEPTLRRYCVDCHAGDAAEADLDLSGFQQLDDILNDHAIWSVVLARVEAGEMPPADAEQMSDSQRQLIVEWISAVLRTEAERTAGDPGPVLARRLSNAEFDNCIRDLTGVDLRPASDFPVDPANAAGFNNSGESLNMSPALLNKYLLAARSVSEHMVFTPRGIDFAPHPVVTDTDRDKYCVNRIVAFYQQQPTDLGSVSK